MGIKISALPSVTDSSNLTLPANQSGVTSKVGTSGANSLAYKDGTGKITVDQLPAAVIGGLTYKGAWNATTNSPPLGNGGAGGTKGDYYVVSVAGATSIDGISDWEIGDWIVHNGTIWEKIDNTDRSIYGTANQVTVTPGPGSGVTLSTPQDIATISSPTFDNLTLTNDLTVKRIAAGSNAVFGTDGDGYTRQWDFSETISDFSASFFWSPLISNITLDPLVNLTGANDKSIYSHDLETIIKAGNTKNFNLVNSLYGSVFHYGTGSISDAVSASFDAVNFSSGTITTLTSVVLRSFNNGTGFITNLNGLDIKTDNGAVPSNVLNNRGIIIRTPVGQAAINTYGLRIENQDIGGAAWAVYSAGGKSYHSGNFGFGNSVQYPRGTIEIGSQVAPGDPSLVLSYVGVTTPFTSITPADIWGRLSYADSAKGGLKFSGYSGDGAPGLTFDAFAGATTLAVPASVINFAKSDGGTSEASLASDEVGLDIQNNGVSVFQVLGSGVKLTGSFLSYDFLLKNEPVPQLGQTIVRATTYSLGLISNQTWTLSGVALKSIDYTYSGGLLDTTIVKVYDTDGITVVAQTTETQSYSGGLDDGSSIVRDI